MGTKEKLVTGDDLLGFPESELEQYINPPKPTRKPDLFRHLRNVSDRFVGLHDQGAFTQPPRPR